MSKLDRLVVELPDQDFQEIQESLIRSRADKFLTLLRLSRERTPAERIQDELGTSSNALYALKSRLYDKIQSHISGDLFCDLEKVIEKLNEIPEICYRKPREISVAYLLKLEDELKQHDMHNELVQVYSALKKMTLFSDSHFQYSQLYNKHIAYNLSVEKSEEILGSFNQCLRKYDFSRSQTHLSTLQFLKKEIDLHCSLHHSRQIEIISTLVSAQLGLFAHTQTTYTDTLQIIEHCADLIEQLPAASPIKPWAVCVDYLRFETLMRMERFREAGAVYSRIRSSRAHLLLMANIVTTSFFAQTEQLYLFTAGLNQEGDVSDLKHDANDVHSAIQIQLARCSRYCFSGDYKEAVVILNNILNRYSMREHVHLSIEVKLWLIFASLRAGRNEMAETLLSNLLRKVRNDHRDYENVTHLFRLFSAEIKSGEKKRHNCAEQLLLFEAKNKGRTEVLRNIFPLLKMAYSVSDEKK